MTTEIIKPSPLQRYYRLHSHIYDATRWSFLFGRKTIIDLVAERTEPVNILEVGCGTGKNLVYLNKRFPRAMLTGVDLSADMLRVAERNTIACDSPARLIHKKYDTPVIDLNGNTIKYDLILCSYALSMFNPGWEITLQTAKKQLADDGIVAVVDFHHAHSLLFRKWMEQNHVRMEQHLLPGLQANFKTDLFEEQSAYLGLWQYLYFIGSKK